MATTLDLRGTGGTLRLAHDGGTTTVRSFMVLGPTGPAGPAGLPGVNAIPANDAVASYLTTPGATADALSTVVTGAVASNPSVVSAAAAAAQSTQGLVLKTDRGVSAVETYEDDTFAKAWKSPGVVGRMLAGIRRSGGWWLFPKGFDHGNTQVRVATSDQYLKATTFPATGTTGARVAEDALDRAGNVPMSTLRRWGARIGAGTTSDVAQWPFATNPTVVTKTVRLDGTGQFATIAAAIASCADSSAVKRYVIDVGDGVYTENKLLRGASWITVRGRHRETVRVVGYLDPSSTDTVVTDTSTFDMTTSSECYLENLTVTIQNGRYALHPESNALNADAVYGATNCHFEHLGNTEVDTWRTANPTQVGAGFDRVVAGGFAGGRIAVGEGSASGASTTLTDCTLKGASTYYLHDNGIFAKPCKHKFVRCRFVGAAHMGINPLGSRQTNPVEFDHCRIQADRFVVTDSPWRNTSTDQPASHNELVISLAGCNPVGADFTGMRGKALRITSATTGTTSAVRVTGTAADAVMGVVRTRNGGGGIAGYAWGYKDVSGINGGDNADVVLTNTLGRLLGDCSTTSKTLTVTIDGGTPVNVVFSTNLTAASNATILSTINSALGSAGTAAEYLVDQGETYPRSDHESLLVNDGTAGIPRWAAVKYGTGRLNVQLIGTADPASAFIGVALEPIAPGGTGRIMHRGKVFATSGVGGQLLGLTTGVTAGTAVSLSGTTAGQFVTGSSKQVGAGCATDLVYFNGNE